MRQPIPFGKYLLLDRISVGGMAEVFKAKSYGVEGFEKIIAIKRILPSMGEDRDFIKMFIDEAKIVGQLAHANICQIFELGRIDGAHFIAMEYIWGKDLLQIQNRLRKMEQPMNVAMACHVIAKVCEGLDYAHKKRDPMGGLLEIVHRDCSPQNVLISYEGEVKIIDFGIAKAASRSSRTQAGVLKGKFGYMSPEQVRGLPLDRRSDIFSVGTVLYECLTGVKLFQGESDFSTLEKVRNVDIDPPRTVNADIPPQVEAIVMKSLEGDVDKRYQWCSEMQADLQKFLMSQQPVFTSKALSAWMREGFAAELTRERKLMEDYKKMGRDGRMAGGPAMAPSAPEVDAEDDVLAAAGDDSEAEPTMLGSPDFGAILAGKRGPGQGDFGEDAPTEIFGEVETGDLGSKGAGSNVDDPDDPGPTIIGGDFGGVVGAMARGAPPSAVPPGVDDDESASAPTVMDSAGLEALRRQVVQQNASGQAGPPPAASGAPTMAIPGPPSAAPGMPPMAMSGSPASSAPTMAIPGPLPSGMPMQPMAAGMPYGMQPPGGGQMPYGQMPGQPPGQPNYYQPPPGQQFGQPPGYGTPDTLFGSTSTVPQLPRPAVDEPIMGKKKRRSSLAKDIGIGVGIALVVLGLFVVGKIFFFKGGEKQSKAQAAPPKGTIAVTVTGDTPAEVFVDDKLEGTVQADKPLKVQIELGVHKVRVSRADARAPCEREINLANVNVEEEVDCKLEPKAPPVGKLVLEGVEADHEVLVDGEAVPDDRKTQPLELAADKAHTIVVKKQDKIVSQFDVTLAPGQEDRRPVTANAAQTDKGTDKEKASGETPKNTTSDKTTPPGDSTIPKRDPRDPKDPKKDPKKNTGTGETTPKDTVDKNEVGYLMADTTPYAKVYVDGTDTGLTTPISPRMRIPLKAGKHKVTFMVNNKKYRYNVIIKAGETLRMKQTLQ